MHSDFQENESLRLGYGKKTLLQASLLGIMHININDAGTKLSLLS